MRQSFIAHLVRLGLLENMYDTPKPGDDFEKVKFDESKGTLKPAQGIAAGAYYVSLIVGVRSATMRIVIQ
jgi:hypothetical protein